MICSKIDTLKAERLKTCNVLEKILATQRGTSEARTEAILRRQRAQQTKTCNGCDRGDELHVGSDGYCSSCSAAIKRMLTFKSNLAVEWPREKRLRRFIEDYQMVPNLPYSLRGNVPRDTIVKCAKHLLDVVIELDTLTKKSHRRRDEE